MSPSTTRRRRLAAAAAVPAAIAALLAALAGTAIADDGQGRAVFRFGDHDRGRTLSGQGVRILPGGEASRDGLWVTVPVDGVEADGEEPEATSSTSWLRLIRGKRGIALTHLRFDLVAGQIKGRLGGSEAEIPIFWQGAPSRVDSSSGHVAVQGGHLNLIAGAAETIERRLGLRRALVGKGAGMVWMAADEDRSPAPEPEPQPEPEQISHAVTGGALDWGVLASWRGYILNHFGPPSPPAPSNAGEIEVGGGASVEGPLEEPSSYISFPLAGGAFLEGVNGADDGLIAGSAGSVTFRKPGHCIMDVTLSDLGVTIDGDAGTLILDSYHDIDVPSEGGCVNVPPAEEADIEFATLDLSGIEPTAAGGVVTWEDVPAQLTAAGTATFGGSYEAGKELDPVTVSAEVE